MQKLNKAPLAHASLTAIATRTLVSFSRVAAVGLRARVVGRTILGSELAYSSVPYPLIKTMGRSALRSRSCFTTSPPPTAAPGEQGSREGHIPSITVWRRSRA